MKTNNLEYLEVKKMLSRLATMLNMLIPVKVSISYVAESTNKSRSAIRQYLIGNFEPNKDFWLEGGKTYMTKDTAITILARANNQKIMQGAYYEVNR